mmetsp:Transcript_4164/g.10180  ORF Transcript_4164/g.10180 Transcript_4164/m.10180 type:complete len:219 (-) Transcript_4164:490-1146(-)
MISGCAESRGRGSSGGRVPSATASSSSSPSSFSSSPLSTPSSATLPAVASPAAAPPAAGRHNCFRAFFRRTTTSSFSRAVFAAFGTKYATAPSGITSPGVHCTSLPADAAVKSELVRFCSRAAILTTFCSSCITFFSAFSPRFSRLIIFAFSSFCSHLLCFFTWRSKSSRVMYVIPQRAFPHLNGRSRVWSALVCTLSALRELSALPQLGHSTSFTPE